MRIIEGIVQGTPEWKALRAKYPCASEAPVVMGKSRHMTRGELLRLKAAGAEREFSDYVQRMVLDKGHAVEGPARAITEEQIGEELYPATAVCDADEFLASLDGVTMVEDRLFEHKQWNEELAACIRAGATEFPDGQEWQLEHQLLVSESAEFVIFVCSDGTKERRVQMEYRRVPGRAEQLRAGWAQFHVDLAAGVAPPAPPKAIAEPLELLPAVSVRMEGALNVVSNLDKLEPLLRAFIERIPVKPNTDQEFATTEAACKALKKLEEELDRSEASALASLEAVDQMQRLKVMLHKLARDTRLQREKLVDARKLEIRNEEINRGKQALADVIAGHNAAIGKPYMPPIHAEFAVAIKGLRTVQSVRDAIDQELARAKIAAAEAFQRIQINMAALRDLASEHRGLFADTDKLVLKEPDDCRAVITSRIAEHKAAEERRLEAERERIRREEAARLEREQAAREAEARRQQEAAARAVAVAELAAAKATPEGSELSPAAQALNEQDGAARFAKAHPSMAANVTPLRPDAAPSLRLGQINERLAPIQLSAEGLARLGFPAAGKDRSAVLYHEADFERMCQAIAAHVHKVQAQRRAA